MPLEPYLYYEGRAEEALEYYKATLGAKAVHVMRFSEAPEEGWQEHIDPKHADKIMHALVHIGDGAFMLADGMCTGQPAAFGGFSLTLASPNPKETEQRFHALAAKGTITMPLAETFFAKTFGMVTDPFGVNWTLITPVEM